MWGRNNSREYLHERNEAMRRQYGLFSSVWVSKEPENQCIIQI